METRLHPQGIRFSIARHAAWAPGIETPEAWAAWADAPFPITAGSDPGVKQMPPMLRRRAGTLGKMALEVAYQCLDGRTGVPTVFCSRHGEVARAVDLLGELVQDAPLSPTSFGLAVHNASAGLFSIARADTANYLALAAGASSIEHAVIEACSLLADGAPEILLVAYEQALPAIFAEFDDSNEQPHAWAWLMTATGDDAVSLSWSAAPEAEQGARGELPGSLAVQQFYAARQPTLERIADRRRWCWRRSDGS